MSPSQLVNAINGNVYFAFAVSLTGLIGFAMSLYISVKTASISKELNKIKIGKEYNRQRKIYIERFEGHKDSILKDSDNSQILADTILQDIMIMEIAFKPLFSLSEKFLIKRAIFNLKRKKTDFRTVCHHLRCFIARLNRKEDIDV